MTTTASPKRLQDQESQACSSIVGSGSKIAGASVEPRDEASVSIRGEEKAQEPLKSIRGGMDRTQTRNTTREVELNKYLQTRRQTAGS